MVHPLRVAQIDDLTRAIDALVTVEGTGAHAYIQSHKLVSGRYATRNLADAVHFFGVLHGRHPGLMDHASVRAVEADERRWYEQATLAFARERAFLAALAVGSGPMPSTPGQQQCETTALAQSHAIDMLGQSERRGCALGAAVALALDWRAVRTVLDAAAERLDVRSVPAALPDLPDTIGLISKHSGSPAMERAIMFGAQQLIAQHRGLWDMLATRETVRGHR